MSTIAVPRATLADLAKTSEKAELIAGRIVPLMPTGHRPNRIAARIFRSLDDFAEKSRLGFAYTDNMGFSVPELASGRESFSPDASFLLGPKPDEELDFREGAPTLAVEVRSKSDYGAAEEAALARKRADYFEAGTPIVWDVDCIANVVRSYSLRSPDRPTVFEAGESAHAEPHLPGWSINVDDLFRE